MRVVELEQRPQRAVAPASSAVSAFGRRMLAATGLVAVAVAHVLDLPNQIHGALYITAGYVVLIAASLVLAGRLIVRDRRSDRQVAALVTGAAALAYIASRTTGLPFDTADIGNWAEHLGIVTLVAETLVLAAVVSEWRSPRAAPVST